MNDPAAVVGTTIRILIVDDHKFVRDGIKAVIAHEPDMQIVGEASNGLEAINAARVLMPDVILMDVRMPEMDGMEATRNICSSTPSARILILTQHDDERYRERAKQLGASGFINKRTTVRDLQVAIRTVARGGYLF
jgi:DNA-binding NarL/FixJ family response regulator